MKKAKTPKFKYLHLTVAPYEGAARIATAINPPKGYAFRRMNRRGTKVTITYERTGS